MSGRDQMAIMAEFVGGPSDGECCAVEGDPRNKGAPYEWFIFAIQPSMALVWREEDEPIPPLRFRQARYQWRDGRYVYVETR
jgi:hypothetical protein